MDFRIRPSDICDLTAISDIYAEAVLHGLASFEIDPPGEEEMAMRFAALAEGGYPAFVAEAGERVIGYAYAGRYRSRPAYRNTVEDSIYLSPAAQGRGVGSALLGRLLAESESRGFRQMVAVIGNSANHASVRLHERHGFRHVGILKSVGYKHGHWLDSVFMQRALGQGSAEPPSR
ncbi:MAG: N-acetyltransferase [Rhizobiales bacterium]|nr:N-acetyltransferase [Hyphomicrobiales bacterium]MBN9009084.1 N-acetyltransferase [Hyphomicrobiales bacterium]